MRMPAPPPTPPVLTKAHTCRYESLIVPAPRPQQQILQPPPFKRPTSMRNYPCTDPSPRRRHCPMIYQTYPICMSPVRAQLLIETSRLTYIPHKGSYSSSKSGPLVPKQSTLHRPLGPSIHFYQFTSSSAVHTEQEIHVPERFFHISISPEHTLKPNYGTCTFG